VTQYLLSLLGAKRRANCPTGYLTSNVIIIFHLIFFYYFFKIHLGTRNSLLISLNLILFLIRQSLFFIFLSFFFQLQQQQPSGRLFISSLSQFLAPAETAVL
jgi:hypothetical protein